MVLYKILKRKDYRNVLEAWSKAYKELKLPQIIREIRKNEENFYREKKFKEAEMKLAS